MAKKKRGLNPSFKIRKPGGKQISGKAEKALYDITPEEAAPRKRGRPERDWPKYTEEELKAMIKKINNGLYRLEKAGLQRESAEYRNMSDYAHMAELEGRDSFYNRFYNVDPATGRVRISADLSKFKNKAERQKAVSIIENILKAKTRTVTGTRKATEAAFEKIKDLYGFKGSKAEYVRIWKTYRDVVNKNQRDRLGSDTVMKLIQNTNLYMLSPKQMAEAMGVLARARTKNSALNQVMKRTKGLKKIKRLS